MAENVIVPVNEGYLDFWPNRLDLPTTTDYEHLADATFLSRRLAEVIGGSVTTESESFSWANPKRYFNLFKENENPIQIAIQQPGETCIPSSSYGAFNLHFRVIAALSDEPIPERVASLDYLVNRFLNLAPLEQTFEHFLTALQREGFVLEQDFNDGIEAPDAPRFFIHWCVGFGHDDFFTEAQFVNDLKHCILHYGGALAEIEVTQTYDENGKGMGATRSLLIGDTSSKKRKRGKGKKDGKGKKETEGTSGTSRVEGHALFIIGWEVINGVLNFDYLNTYSPDWGLVPYEGYHDENIRGYGRIRSEDIHHVYVPQVLKA